ncbi:MAG: restriction endonuclease [Deltaproteobacteria bacterium]|nr:restriction endonuclease [Deltaproteobacteria bacterium]
MTFYEAAVEVLREAGRPLHYKKITENAIRRSLLSHVGKTPEETMHARLQQEVKKPNGLALIEQARPGVFALKAGVDPSDAKETLSFRQPPAEPAPAPVAAPVAAQSAPAVAPATVEEPAAEAAEVAAEKPAKGRKKSAKTLAAEAAAEAAAAEAAAATVAETEAEEEPATEEASEVTTALDLEWDPSDVEPLALFGETLDDAPTAGGTVLDAPSTANAERRRKRRGRRGGRGRGREDEEGTEGSDDEGDEAPEERPATAAAQPQRSEQPRGENNRGENGRGESNRDGGDRNRQQPAQPAANAQAAANAQPARPLARLAPDAAATELERILFEAVAKLQPGSSTRAEELGAVLSATPVGTLGKLGGHGVRAIVRASAARRAALGRPPLIEELRPDGFGVAGTVTGDISRSMQSLEAWAEAHNKLVQDRLLTTLKQLSELHLAHVFSLLLNQLGYASITTGEGAESIMGYLHARQDRSLTPGKLTVAVVSPRGQATATEVAALREVAEAAGSNDLILFAVRGFTDEATAAAAEGSPVTLIDRDAFGALLLQHGVGVTRHTIALQLPDEALLRDLRA